MLRLRLRPLLLPRTPLLSRPSSGSPSPSNVPDDHFIKTGQRPASDPSEINLRSNEYSQSGGDDMVAAQGDASFGRGVDAGASKEVAGRGNVVNPLELSPATPELSRGAETYVEKNVERTEDMRTGMGVTRKKKVVVKTENDFDMGKREVPR
ncbi:hypothetical protein GRF29_8g468201 [Pseudopithomyces chartarum]|uniref:Uncharacterized protein n=1 Tax=Pseudopithomyces chartarum TaxID=1892770 RepID=A0AAN6RJG1_9PLEO|nr:hypothetical protein GRF29_8g468201 [Pseudopithomyces chartarum]